MWGGDVGCGVDMRDAGWGCGMRVGDVGCGLGMWDAGWGCGMRVGDVGCGLGMWDPGWGCRMGNCINSITQNVLKKITI